tara:strand:- start:370 stop:1389 length:1020 start_codon:yes stop_codon:yes gene_type:complete
MYYKIIILPIILYIINVSLRKFNFLIDDPTESYHKLEKKFGTPLSGGIFIFSCILITSFFYNNNIFNINIIINFLLILILGIFSDIKKNFSPKLRIIIQLILIIIFVYSNDLLIFKTNIDLIDLFLNEKIFAYCFTIFCIITLLNGYNFMDGVNVLVSGYILIILFTLNLILHKIGTDMQVVNLIMIYLFFFIFNFFGKCFLGDNGVYLSSFLVSFLIIKIINENNSISPILAVTLLWYPAFENLFSILRRIKNKKTTYYPDKFHLHSLILRKLQFINKSNNNILNNTLSGSIILVFLIPNFVIAYFFYDKSYYLFSSVIVYLSFYLVLYNYLLKVIKK